MARTGAFARRALAPVLFLAPALLLIGALLVYPIFYTIARSAFDAPGHRFVGLANYQTLLTRTSTLRAVKNNLIWVVFAPALATALGLVFAVLTERVSWSKAFRIAVFMPMAVSMLASGVIWRLVYQDDPSIGLGNALVRGVASMLRPPGRYPGAQPSQPRVLAADGQAFVTTRTFAPGDSALLGLVAIAPRLLPAGAAPARSPVPAGAPTQAGTQAGAPLRGVVWLDFTRGGGGTPGVVDPAELGLPGVTVEALTAGGGGKVAATATTDWNGVFAMPGLRPGRYRLRLAASTFRPPYGGIFWLGPSLVTPALIVSFLWIWAGFAMVVIGAGLATMPREVLEAARIDGASEWQVFRRVTVPLLMPVLAVVVVTLAINVLKIFDLVLVIPPDASQESANVLAMEMWRASFGGAQDQGLGSAIAVVLFVLVAPAMLLNLKRLKGGRG